MYRLILTLVCLFVVANSAVWLANKDAVFDLALIIPADQLGQDDEIVTSIRLLPISLALGFALILSLLGGRIWQFVAALPARLAERRAAQRKERGYVALTKGLAAVAAGDARESSAYAEKTKALLKDQKLTALLLAQSAQLRGQPALASQEYRALLDDEETAFLGLRGLAMQALRQGRGAEALRHVRAAQALKPNAPWVIDLLYQLELQEGCVLSSAEAVKTAHLNDWISRDVAATRLAPLYTAAAQQALEQQQGDEALKLTHLALERLPAYLPAILVRAQALIASEKFGQAKTLIQRAWRQAAHPDLLPLYLNAAQVGSHKGGDDRAERRASLALIKSNRHRDGQLALGEFLLTQLDLPPARAALEAAQNQGSIRAAHLLDEFAAIERALDVPDDAEAVAKQAACDRAANLVQVALTMPNEQAWICASCGSHHPTWTLMCDSCGDEGLIGWEIIANHRIQRPSRTLLEPPTLSGL